MPGGEPEISKTDDLPLMEVEAIFRLSRGQGVVAIVGRIDRSLRLRFPFCCHLYVNGTLRARIHRLSVEFFTPNLSGKDAVATPDVEAFAAVEMPRDTVELRISREDLVLYSQPDT